MSNPVNERRLALLITLSICTLIALTFIIVKVVCWIEAERARGEAERVRTLLKAWHDEEGEVYDAIAPMVDFSRLNTGGKPEHLGPLMMVFEGTREATRYIARFPGGWEDVSIHPGDAQNIESIRMEKAADIKRLTTVVVCKVSKWLVGKYVPYHMKSSVPTLPLPRGAPDAEAVEIRVLVFSWPDKKLKASAIFSGQPPKESRGPADGYAEASLQMLDWLGFSPW